MRSLVVLALCVPGLALADTPKEHFQRATEADKEGRYSDAINEYQQAYELSPHPDVLFNIAADYEHLEQWDKTIEFLQRYLDERDTPATDAAQVERRIRALRAKLPPPPPPPVPIEDHPPEVQLRVPAVVPPAPVPVWHVGGSYGFAFGEAPSERYLAHGGRTFGGRLDTDAIVGAFGRNDYAIGVMARLAFTTGKWAPFVRGGATLGFAKQDSSSTAGTRFPLGLEAGGGIQFGARGRFELAALMRFVRGGWDASSTTSPSYINDTFAFALDLGFSFDVPFSVGGQ